MSNKEIPINAFRFTVGEFELGDNGQDAKTAPIKMVARTGQAITHWYWGKVIHDLSGMTKHKSRLPIDYCHDDKEVIGYLNQFDTETGDLVTTGALVPYKENDRASEIVYKSKQGVPYEASINFGGEGIKIEEIAEGQVTTVNGYEFEGPGVVIRSWPLRGVAVCPYGADQNTSSEFASAEKITVTVIDTNDTTTDEVIMSNENVEAQEAVETKNNVEVTEVEVKVQDAQEAETEVVATEHDAEETTTEKPETDEATPLVEAVALSGEAKPAVEPSEGEKFMVTFGEAKGAVYFAKGMSFETALTAHLEWQTEEIEKLSTQLSTYRENDRGFTPVAFRSETEAPVKGPAKQSLAGCFRIAGTR